MKIISSKLISLSVVTLALVFVSCIGSNDNDKDKDIIRVGSVRLLPNNLTLQVGQRYWAIDVEVNPMEAWDQRVDVKSSDEKVINITPVWGYWEYNAISRPGPVISSVIVEALRTGNATITATSHDGNKIGTCYVAVVPANTGIAISDSGNQAIVLKGNPSGNGHGEIDTIDVMNWLGYNPEQKFMWTSSDDKVATIIPDRLGHQAKVYSWLLGTATITVTTESGEEIVNFYVTVY
jgi:uncharacterized protein YjdB